MEEETTYDLKDLDMAALAQQQPKNLLIRNHFYLYDEIDMDIAKALIVSISEMAMDITKSSLETGMNVCPIHLHVCSPGGDLTAALAIVNFIKRLQKGEVASIGNVMVPIEVYTHIEGEADSGGSLIACVGSKRFCSKYAMSLIHPMRTFDGTHKTPEEQKQALENTDRWNEIYRGIYLEHSKLTAEQLTEMFKKEKYYNPEELKEFGLIEEIEEC